MISFLRGKVVTKVPPLLVLDVNGVGYELLATTSTFVSLPDEGEEVQLQTHYSVREDSRSLFAFVNEAERAMFRLLIKVNGVGAKMALVILSEQTADEFHRCINDNDVTALVRLPGVGKKTAERLIIEMRDKLPEREFFPEEAAASPHSVKTSKANRFAKQEAISGLCALGYKATEARKMVQNIPQEDKSCEDIIRLALQGKS